MHPLIVIAAKEFRDGLRNRWVAGATILLAALAFVLTMVGSSPTGMLDVKPLTVTVVSISSLTIFLVPLIALLLGYDAIVGEAERGCLLLMLTYPVSRAELLLGKFLGHASILAFATIVGYGGAGLAAAFRGGADAESWQAFSALLLSSIMLGLSFLALSYLISTIVKERSTAAGLAVGIWLLFVVVFDLALMGALVASKGGVWADLFPKLLLLNPADAYRLFNLSAFDSVRKISGLGGLSASARFPAHVLLGVLAAWIVLPLAGALFTFSRRQA